MNVPLDLKILDDLGAVTKAALKIHEVAPLSWGYLVRVSKERLRLAVQKVVHHDDVRLVAVVGADVVETGTTLRNQGLETFGEPILRSEAVLITREECVLLPSARSRWLPLEVVAEKCNGCTLCFRIGCPAILKSDELDARLQRPKAIIDAALCTGCEVCAQICPRDAITFRPAVMSEA